jgi:hypothetical protein
MMAAMGGPIPPSAVQARKRVISALRRARYDVVDASSETTGKDYLLKIWSLAVSAPIGIAVVHEGIRPETMANVFYELGWMQAYGRETVVVKVGDVRLPSDLVRTEYIPFDATFSGQMRSFISSLSKRADYYLTLADQLEKNPLLAIDYLRRSFLLSGDESLRRRAEQIIKDSGLAMRAVDSVERNLARF